MTINYLGNYFAPRGSKNPTGASNTAKAKTEGVPIADVDDVDRSPFHNDHDAAVGGDLTVPSEGMNNNNNNSKRSHPSLSTSSSSSSSSSILLRDKNNKTTKHESSTLLLSSSSNSSSNDSNTWTVTPISLLLRTMGYMDNDTLMMMCLVCKQINELIKNGEGMERQLIRVFELRPSGENHNNLRIELFLSNMNRYWQDGTKRRMLQGYQHWKIYNASRLSNYVFISQYEKLERLVSPHLRMTGIVDLDISSPVPNRIMGNCALVHLVALLVPNLRKLDISNFRTNPNILIKVSRLCPHLEVLKWNKWDNDDDFDVFPADGRCLESFKYLKELYLDGVTFSFTAEIDEGRRMADMENHPNEFMFHELCKNNPLERVSIRHARSYYSPPHARYNAAEFDPITQNVLINFVRNVPSTLVLFRSDLSTENIRMLQLERPGIELVN